jgi:hypothetical protein
VTPVLAPHTIVALGPVRCSPLTKSWIVVALGIVPLDPQDAAHTYVTSIAVPDSNIVTLHTILTVLGCEYHQVPHLYDIEEEQWQTWETSWFVAYTPTSDRCPWYFPPLSGVYKAIQMPHGMDRPLLMVAPGTLGYDAALRSAQSRSAIGTAHLPEGTPVYSLYFNQQVCTPALRHSMSIDITCSASRQLKRQSFIACSVGHLG